MDAAQDARPLRFSFRQTVISALQGGAAAAGMTRTPSIKTAQSPKPANEKFFLYNAPPRRTAPARRRAQQSGICACGGENGMFSHIMVGSNDIARSKKFYDALFAAIGAAPGTEDTARGRLAYMHNGARFMVTKPIDGRWEQAGRGCPSDFLIISRPEESNPFGAVLLRESMFTRFR
jgi:hypothetical protein